MHEMNLVFDGESFLGYGFSAKMCVTGSNSIKKNKEMYLDGVFGDFTISMITPQADIDLMLELSAKNFFVNHFLKKKINIDDINITCVIDEDGHNVQNTLLSALLAWLNYYDVADDSVRESVADLSIFDQKIILCYCERRILSESILSSIISNFISNPDIAISKYASKLVSR